MEVMATMRHTPSGSRRARYWERQEEARSASMPSTSMRHSMISGSSAGARSPAIWTAGGAQPVHGDVAVVRHLAGAGGEAGAAAAEPAHPDAAVGDVAGGRPRVPAAVAAVALARDELGGLADAVHDGLSH
ncbi:hypothetical protein AB0A77_20560 [Streptomyces varsoviensis]|uniref:hypothetical protein n=1 Tax=Streptomyces varsoviensis TaxID=67373 RepID=UPI0033E8F200